VKHDREIALALTGRDEMGRQSVPRLSPFTLIVCAARAGVRLRVVPPEFLTEDGEDVVVACPCGAKPRVASLQIVPCVCERYYFHGVNDVWSLGFGG
jgi:hypothetical protein